ncbi:MAG: TadE/TadG family type IV pilus assembly protein [Pseudomonadota bacterium]
MRDFISTLHDRLRRLTADGSGNVAIIFALCLVPIIGLIGAAIDYGRASQTRERLQNAVDATTLAVRQVAGTMSQTELEEFARGFLDANLNGDVSANIVELTFDADSDALDMRISTEVDTALLGLMGISEVPVEAHTRAVVGRTSFEIALVLDNSGSMAGNRLSNLKDATGQLVDTLFGEETTHPEVSIAVVPFAAAVNVGPDHATASWIDRHGQSSIHFNNLSSDETDRLGFFDEMRNVSWGGCVEARPYPLDVLDTPPGSSVSGGTGGNGDTLFVPLFAPDEPDRGATYYNSYLPDSPAACGPQNVGWSDYNSSNEQRDFQEQVCKYENANPNTQLSYGTRVGPNMLCDAVPLTPLTNRKSVLDDAVEDLDAYGGTNIHMGLMWGWRTLSPGAPFTTGLPYDDETNRKILVLMTDGANFHGAFNNINGSWYSAYGYAEEDRLGNNLTTSTQLRNAMNQRTSEACENIKNAGIAIYTIAFDVPDDTTRDLIQSCASSGSMAYTARTSSEMVDVFVTITNQLSQLRLTR